MAFPAGANITFLVLTANPSTSEPADIDASGLPTFDSYRTQANGTVGPGPTMTATRIGTGQYRVTLTMPLSANEGDLVDGVVYALLGGKTYARPIYPPFQCSAPVLPATIAAAVRDIDNTTPATNSLGWNVNQIMAAANDSADFTRGTVRAATQFTLQLAADAPTLTNQFTILLTKGTGKGQLARVESFDAATKTATITPGWNTLPDTTTEYSASRDWIGDEIALDGLTVAASPTPTPTVFAVTGADLNATTGAYDGMNLLFSTGALIGIKRVVQSHVYASGVHTITLATALPAAPAANDTGVFC